MTHGLRTIWVIARRDYVTIVFSRLFLLFVAMPGIAAAVGAAFASIAAYTDAAPAMRAIVVADPRTGEAIVAARARLVRAFGDGTLPPVEIGARGDRGRALATIAGPLAHPRVSIAADAPPDVSDLAQRLIAEAHAAVAQPPPAPSVGTAKRDPAIRASDEVRVGLAKGAQYAIFLFTLLLAGRLLSNFIEERGNKVIELLVAAAPVDAIFYGKLLGMLMFSFTCIVAWIGGAAAVTAATRPELFASLAAPAIGWPSFLLLGAIYFALGYLLIGTVMLGLGAQTRTPADVQTLALPITLAQIGFFGLARLGVGDPASAAAALAGAVPWSASLTMIARAAEDPRWWPQLLSITWQLGWLWLSVRFASARFRRAVLSSGPVRGRSAKS